MDPFVAEIRIFTGNFAPKGWALCDGQLLPISQTVLPSPMKRFAEVMEFAGSISARAFAACPTSTLPSDLTEMAEGRVERPSTGIVSTAPRRQTQATELVVPKSMPIG